MSTTENKREEELCYLGEEHWGFGADHAHVLVGLHDAFDSRQWQIVVRLKARLRPDLQAVHLLTLLGPELGKCLLASDVTPRLKEMRSGHLKALAVRGLVNCVLLLHAVTRVAWDSIEAPG